MTNKEKNILDLLQKKFPLTERPYLEIAKLLKTTEPEVIKKIKDLQYQGYIKYIGAIINTAALNYESALVAFNIKPEKLSDAVKIINSHEGVSHNYLRDCEEYNVWFTIAAAKGENLKKTVNQLARLCYSENSIILPAIKTYKVKVILDIANAAEQNSLPKPLKEISKTVSGKKLSAEQELILSHLQYGLPPTSEPFKKIAENISLPVPKILEISKDLLEKGFIKRFGTIVSHTKTGYKFNALVLWKAPLSKIDSCGKTLSSNKNISHCYRRRAYPRWPYSLYTMVHAKTEREFWLLMEDFARQTKLKGFRVLKTKKEFKKKRLIYFAKNKLTLHTKIKIP